MSPAIDAASHAPALARMMQIRSRFGVTVPSTGATTGLEGSGTGGTTVEGTNFASLLGTASSAGSLTGAAGSTATGSDAVNAAGRYLGVPYVWGGTDPARGLDCSGLVQRAYQDIGVDLPRVARDQAKTGTEVPSLEQAKPGDLIAFGEPVDHISIYAGDGKIIQAPRTGDVVKVSDIHRPIATIRRILPEGTAGVPSISAPSGAGSQLSASDAVALRQLLQLVTRQLTATATSSYGSAAYGSAGSIGLGIGAGDQALSTVLNGTGLNGTSLNGATL